MSSDAYAFDHAVKKSTAKDVRLNLTLVGAVLFCASAWAGVAYLVVGLINH